MTHPLLSSALLVIFIGVLLLLINELTRLAKRNAELDKIAKQVLDDLSELQRLMNETSNDASAPHNTTQKP